MIHVGFILTTCLRSVPEHGHLTVLASFIYKVRLSSRIALVLCQKSVDYMYGSITGSSVTNFTLPPYGIDCSGPFVLTYTY
jgi:hypothetical protein